MYGIASVLHLINVYIYIYYIICSSSSSVSFPGDFDVGSMSRLHFGRSGASSKMKATHANHRPRIKVGKDAEEK